MRKGQAAMEFLMTYGWAILVVLAAIGALAYFGVLSPDRFLPDKCVANPPFTCTQHVVTADSAGDLQVELGIQNNAGVSVGSRVTFSGDCTTASPYYNATTDNGDELHGGVILFDCTETLNEGDRYDIDFSVNYRKSGEDVNHTTTGTITGRVEPR